MVLKPIELQALLNLVLLAFITSNSVPKKVDEEFKKITDDCGCSNISLKFICFKWLSSK